MLIVSTELLIVSKLDMLYFKLSYLCINNHLLRCLGRGRAHVVRSLPPPCVREPESPRLLIGCCLAGARNAYITTPNPRPAPPRPGPGARQAGGKRRGHAHAARRGGAPDSGRGCIVLLLWWSLIKMASSWSSVGTRRLEA